MTTFVRLRVRRVFAPDAEEAETAGYDCAFNFRLVDRYYALDFDDDDEEAARACVVMDGVEYYVAQTSDEIDSLLAMSQFAEGVALESEAAA